MADLFGSTEVLPSWLRDDGSRFNKAFAMGASIGQAQQENRRADAADRRAETHSASNEAMQKLQIQGEKLKVDDAEAFHAESPELIRWGQGLLKAQSQEELDAIPTPSFRSLTSIDQAEKIKDRVSGQLAEKKMKRFGKDLELNRMQALFSKGAELTPEEDQTVFSKTHMATDPKGYLHGKQLLDQATIRANSVIDAADINAAAKALSTGLGGARGVQAREGVDNFVIGMNSIGQKVSDADKAEMLAKATLGGMSAMNAPQHVVKDLEAENKSYQQLEKVTERISKFDEKFGPGAFDEYVGPVDSPIFSFKTRAVDPAKLSTADSEAKDIFRDANYIIQGYRKNNFGTALTESETAAFKQIVGDPSFADYSNGLSTFKNSVKRGAGIGVADHRLSPNIPLSIKQRFLPPAIVSIKETPGSISVGDTRDGYVFMGGDLAKKTSWKKK